MEYIFEGHLVDQETWEYYWYYEDWDLYMRKQNNQMYS